MISVLVVDDEALVRAGFTALLDDADDITVVTSASNGAQAVAAAREHRPDVVLMDLRMPVMDGIEATELIGRTVAGARVLVVTTFDDDAEITAALAAGAAGFVVKDTPPEKLLEAVRVIAGGEALLSPRVTSRIVGMLATTVRANVMDYAAVCIEDCVDTMDGPAAHEAALTCIRAAFGWVMTGDEALRTFGRR